MASFRDWVLPDETTVVDCMYVIVQPPESRPTYAEIVAATSGWHPSSVVPQQEKIAKSKQSRVAAEGIPPEEAELEHSMEEAKHLGERKRCLDKKHPRLQNNRYADHRSTTNLHGRKRCRVRDQQSSSGDIVVPQANFRTYTWWDDSPYEPKISYF